MVRARSIKKSRKKSRKKTKSRRFFKKKRKQTKRQRQKGGIGPDDFLHEVAMNGHTDEVNRLIENDGMDVNAGDLDGSSPLHYASSMGHSETVQALIDHNATIDNINESQETPLWMASANGHTEIVNKLLEHGAEINRTGRGGMTALTNATDSYMEDGFPDTVQAMIDAGAVVDNVSEFNGRTALLNASEHGNHLVVKKLLDNGANPNHQDHEGNSALHLAAGRFRPYHRGHS
jgi:uncharacterized protein